MSVFCIKWSWQSNVVLSNGTIAKIPSIEYLIADPDIIALIFNQPDSNLKWVQCTNAGVDRFFEDKISSEVKTPKFQFTRHFISMGQMLAEFVLGRIIFRERYFGRIHDFQKECFYPKGMSDIKVFRTLDQLEIGILGMGHVGRTVATYCKNVKMTVWGVVRDKRYVMEDHMKDMSLDHVRPVSRLSEVLESCDYLVSVLPNTPLTCNFLSGNVLEPCQRKKTVLISIGRGNVIDDQSLINAIESGWLGGAILDVFKEEPLPPSSPLWTLPGVDISPHNSGSILSGKQPVDSFMCNLKLYLEGKPMESLVDFSKGY